MSHQAIDYVNDWDILDKDYSHYKYNNEESIKIVQKQKVLNGENPPELARQGPAFEEANVTDDAYSDGQTTNKAIELLKKFKNSDEPFFMALGYIEPHLPFMAPSKYWDMYKPEDIKLAKNPFLPKDAVNGFLHNSPELRNMYTDIPQEGPIPDDLAKKLVHGYYASISYTDAMIGKVYDALEKLGLKDNTTIILWGDHGFFLGQHTMWTKHSTLMEAISVPLIIASPGFDKGKKTNSLAEYVDIYPTLCAIAGINAPKYLDGKSLLPILQNSKSKIHNEVFSRYGNQEVVVNERYSYMELVDKNSQKVNGRMLFDHSTDPLENFNIAEKDENKALVKEMSIKLFNMRLHTNKQPDISK